MHPGGSIRYQWKSTSDEATSYGAGSIRIQARDVSPPVNPIKVGVGAVLQYLGETCVDNENNIHCHFYKIIHFSVYPD